MVAKPLIAFFTAGSLRRRNADESFLDSCREDRRVGCGKARALYLLLTIVACVVQAARSSRTEQTDQHPVPRIAQMEEHRNSIGVNDQVAVDCPNSHEE